ncbi:MAG: arginyl-tRNA--protein-N-Asp/Glu arginylyltransferase [Candidatus Endobugula sp.]|jgi:arginyl-tRNA--protein-N-Asp/Glu arginylyltransferase
MSKRENTIDAIEEITDLESLQFFQTQPHACSYLEGETASTIFLNPKQSINRALYSELSEYGFRRSGTHIYKPLCENCNACVPMRIPVDLFAPSRSQKRTWKRNQDLSVRRINSIDTTEQYALYDQYIRTRHQDGDMFPPSESQFQSFLGSSWHCAYYYEFRCDGQLIATAVVDIMDNGLSAVYTYFDPVEDKRSLGSHVILYLIEEAKKLKLPSVYLGYWIKNSSKMNYKSAYRPLEIQSGNQWILVS